MPTVESWLSAAIADAERRGLAPLKPLLETLARSTAALREADETHRAATVKGGRVLPPDQPPPRLRRSAEAFRAKAEGGSPD